MNIETANRLYEFRKKHHLSQEELAEKIGVSRQAVSKWERAEASPDTDNLILLAKVYGVTLDELLTGETEPMLQAPEVEVLDEQEAQETTESPEAQPTEEPQDRVSFQNGIHVEAKNGDKVHVGWDGIYVHDAKNGENVSIDKNGIFVGGEEKHIFHHKKSIWYQFPYPLLALIGFLIWGFLGGWHISWILFLTIPLYYSLVDAICKRKPHHFAYPVLALVIFLWTGIELGLWHPMWILFLTIPVYYWVCMIFSKNRK